jgi:REP element-mobilizing transposase RayT
VARQPLDPASGRAPERAAHNIYIHVAWWTLGRLPLMPIDLRGLVEAQLIALARRLDVEPIAVRAAPDRVRLLLRLKPGHTLATLVPRLKHGSQEALTRAGRGVHWASGFAATSVSSDAVRDVIRRIGDLD